MQVWLTYFFLSPINQDVQLILDALDPVYKLNKKNLIIILFILFFVSYIFISFLDLIKYINFTINFVLLMDIILQQLTIVKYKKHFKKKKFSDH